MRVNVRRQAGARLSRICGMEVYGGPPARVRLVDILRASLAHRWMTVPTPRHPTQPFTPAALGDWHSCAMTQVTSPAAASGPDANTRYSGRATIIAAAITGVFGLIGGLIGGLVLDAGGAESVTSEPPDIELVSFNWVEGEDGRTEGHYELKGKVANLSSGQMVWSYNQRLTEDGDPEGIYPDLGPCPVDSDGAFICDLGWAGDVEKDKGRTFRIYAAVVSDEDAHAASVVKSNLSSMAPYSSVSALPHVDGQETLEFREEVRPPE